MTNAELYANALSEEDLLVEEARVGKLGKGGVMRTYQIEGGGTYRVLIADPELQKV